MVDKKYMKYDVSSVDEDSIDRAYSLSKDYQDAVPFHNLYNSSQNSDGFNENIAERPDEFNIRSDDDRFDGN